MAGNRWDVFFSYFAVDKFSGVLKEIKKQNDTLLTALEKTKKQLTEVGKGFEKAGKGMIKYFTAPILALGTASIVASAKMETMRVSLSNLLRSPEKGAELEKQLLDIAKTAPFMVTELGVAARQLIAFGVPFENVADKVKQLGDIAAVSGGDLEGLANLVGTAFSQKFVGLGQLADLQSMGIPIFKEIQAFLKEKTGNNFSERQIRKFAENMQLSPKVLEGVFKNMTANGGQFFEGMSRKTDTLSGLFVKLADNAFIAGAQLGDILAESINLKQILNDLVHKMQGVIESFKRFSAEHPTIVKWIARVIVGIAIIGPILLGIAIAIKIVVFSWIAFKMLGTITMVLVGAVKLLALALWTVAKHPFLIAITLLIAGAIALYTHFDELKALISDFFENSPIGKFIANVAKLAFMLHPVKLLFDGIVAAINLIASGWDKVKGWFGGGNKSASNMTSPSTANNLDYILKPASMSPQASLDINVNDPMKFLKSITTQNTGFSNFNLGTNNPGVWR